MSKMEVLLGGWVVPQQEETRQELCARHPTREKKLSHTLSDDCTNLRALTRKTKKAKNEEDIGLMFHP